MNKEKKSIDWLKILFIVGVIFIGLYSLNGMHAYIDYQEKVNNFCLNNDMIYTNISHIDTCLDNNEFKTLKINFDENRGLWFKYIDSIEFDVKEVEK